MRNPINTAMLTVAFVCLLTSLAYDNSPMIAMSAVACIFWMVQIWTR